MHTKNDVKFGLNCWPSCQLADKTPYLDGFRDTHTRHHMPAINRKSRRSRAGAHHVAIRGVVLINVCACVCLYVRAFGVCRSNRERSPNESGTYSAAFTHAHSRLCCCWRAHTHTQTHLLTHILIPRQQTRKFLAK